MVMTRSAATIIVAPSKGSDTRRVVAMAMMMFDDDPDARELVIKLLDRLGHSDVTGAENGVEALVALDAVDSSPEALFVDLEMPEMGGVELLRHLADREYPGKVVLISGADEDTLAVAEGMAKYRGVNVVGYIAKPASTESLAKILA
jgi:CheY-like chemotaxis protein